METTRRQFLGIAGAGLAAGALALRWPISADAAGGTLLFGMGIHIEPFGATPSALAGAPATPPSGGGISYLTGGIYDRHAANLRLLGEMAERHGGALTIQTQTAFTTMAIGRGDPILADLAARGHEIALHFHEDAHLGKRDDLLPVETWAAVMAEEISFIRALGAPPVRYWSGGNLYPGVLEAGARAGLDVLGDYKNPNTQQSDSLVLGVHPWRPATGPIEGNMTGFARHDPAAPVVYLPSGRFSRTDYAGARRSPEMGGDAGYFEFLRRSIAESQAAATPDRVNVFHFTMHPGEFQDGPTDPHRVVEQFLVDTIDPAVRAGTLRWATYSQMADAFRAWEAANPGVDPRDGEGVDNRRLIPALPQGSPSAMLRRRGR